ncbi:MAG TPA: hypothetical protein VFA16_10635, partial [Mycobacterium sp.]|uniref:hypothetical protein n=1 Tax=Mycobacterium sp. TaxID=1785 RepID=UPI002D3F8445
AMSDDDRYLAAIVAPVRGSGSSSPKPRQLLIWDASMGTPLAVAAPFADQLATRAAPLAVRFLPGTDTLLVNTFSGTLYRMGPQGTQERSELLRQAPAGAHTVALETGVGGIYLLESDPAANATRSDRVVLLDPDGSMRRSWDVTSLKISIGQIAALSDGGALLVDNAGRAYRLGTDGRVGAAVDLNAGVVTDAHQLPGTQIVMLAVQRSSVISSTEEYDLSKDVVVRTGGPGVPLFSFATTKDGAYLAGSDLLDVRGVLAALRPQDKAANLCAVAGRELTQQEWDAYVGSVAPYRKLCMDADGGLAPFYDAGRQGLYLSTPQIARTPSASEAASYANACAAPQSDGYTTSGPFSWRAGTDSTAICVNGAPEWVVHPTPRLQIKPATIGGQSVLVVSGQTFGNPGTGASQMSTAFDVLSPTAVDISSSASATAAITTDATGVTLTAAQGDIEVATTYGVDQNGDWTLLSQTPVGAALTVTSAKK